MFRTYFSSSFLESIDSIFINTKIRKPNQVHNNLIGLQNEIFFLHYHSVQKLNFAFETLRCFYFKKHIFHAYM